MASSPNLPPQLTMSLGGESVPFTVQAEGSRMSLDEAVGSGLLELPDEPGMERFAVSINVMVPGHLLQPPPPAALDRAPAEAAADMAARPRRRTDPIAAEKIAASLRRAAEPEEAASFRSMLRATRPARNPPADQDA